MMKKILSGMFCCFLVVLVTGCAPIRGANQEHIESSTIDSTHPRAKLVIGSSGLVNKIVMTNVRFGQAGQFQRVALGLQNRTNKRFEIEYKIDWQDAQGFAVNQNTVWHRLTLTPKQITDVQSVGKVPEAYKVMVNVRIIDDYFIEANKQESKKKRRRN